MSASRYFYTDPRGLRSGPFTEEDLVRLAEIGGLEFSGFIELEGFATRWRVAEVPWLRNELTRRGRRPIRPARPPEEPRQGGSPPPPEPLAAEPLPPGPLPPGPLPPEPARVRPEGQPPAATPRSMFILLALLPALAGIFGIHNIVAGYIARGVTQLVLSVLTLGSIAGGLGILACCCFGLPLWPVLFIWTLVEVVVVERDARGTPFS